LEKESNKGLDFDKQLYRSIPNSKLPLFMQANIIGKPRMETITEKALKLNNAEQKKAKKCRRMKLSELASIHLSNRKNVSLRRTSLLNTQHDHELRQIIRGV